MPRQLVYRAGMRVISMVPSWTETLIEAGVDVIGRTRYCIHPSDNVSHIPIIGGTKDAQYSEIEKQKADLIILDQEENPKLMADKIRTPFFASHIESVKDMAPTLKQLSVLLQNPNLLTIAERWEKVIATRPMDVPAKLQNLPGVLDWWSKPESAQKCLKFTYVIWKNPWMAVSASTFIGSMFETLGYSSLQLDFPSKYEKFSWSQIPPETLILFSSEPYAFEKEKTQLLQMGYACALVNGESWSWFGIRSLRFLEEHLALKKK